MPNGDSKNFSLFIIEALRAKGISVEKVSQLSGVPESFISLIIDEKFDKLPPAPYVHGYIIKMSEVLGLDGEKVWNEYFEKDGHLRRSGERDILPQNRFEIPKINKKIAGAIIIAALVVIYAGIRLPSILGRPALTLENISGGITVTKDQNFTIKGTVTPGDELNINGESIIPDKNGIFEKAVVLNPGFNTFTFTATKVLGRTYSVTRQIFYETSSTDMANPAPGTTTDQTINQTSTEKNKNINVQ